jgi:biotin carboxyl carrier protein
MKRNRSLLALAACVLLPASLSMACREKATDAERAAVEPTPGTYVRPLEGTEWTSDPPAVTGIADPLTEAAAAADRERLLAEREAAVALREAEVARREAAAVSAPAPRRASSATRTSAPAPAPAPEPRRAQRDYEPEPEPRREPVRRTTRVTVPAGTTIAAEMIGGVSTDTAQVGDSVTARVAENVYAGGELAIPAGSTLRGSVTAARGLRRVGGRAQLALRFDTVELRSGGDAPIYATYERLGRSETKRDAATIGGSAVGGAILGRVLNRRLPGDRDRNTAAGAAVGAAVGTVIAARNRGQEVELPSGSMLELTLADSVTVSVR